jgi:hypothetical protein
MSEAQISKIFLSYVFINFPDESGGRFRIRRNIRANASAAGDRLRPLIDARLIVRETDGSTSSERTRLLVNPATQA